MRPSSQEIYSASFSRYLRWCGESPESLLAKASDVNWLDDHLKAWYEEMKKRGLAHGSRRTSYAIVRSFYRWNNKALPKSPRHYLISSTLEPERIYTIEEIRKMYAVATNFRDRSLLMCLAHCPQRIEIYRAMRWSMVSEQVLGDRGITIVSVQSEILDSHGNNCNKAAVPYRFPLLSEATEAMRLMMEERKRAGENIRPESWLFRGYSTRRARNPVRVSEESDSTPLTNGGIEEIIDGLARKAGIQEFYKTPKLTKTVFHPHGFRKYFRARVREVWRTLAQPMDSILLEAVLGHKLPYAGAYDKFSEKYLTEIFTELEPFLSILSSSSEVKKKDAERQKILTSSSSSVLHQLYTELSGMFG